MIRLDIVYVQNQANLSQKIADFIWYYTFWLEWFIHHL